jgi:excisionase family DNA binding protein
MPSIHPNTRSGAVRPGATRAVKPRPAPRPDALAYRINDACELIGIGRTTAYKLIAEGRLEVTRAAGRVLIVGDSLRALLTSPK